MSGAGKSTLVRCINFLEVPTKGRVLINGKSLGDYTSRELRKQREDIGMIFQHFNLLMQKNVLENVFHCSLFCNFTTFYDCYMRTNLANNGHLMCNNYNCDIESLINVLQQC